MYAAVVGIELLLLGVQSLKQKRSILRSLTDVWRKQGSYSVAETAHHNKWQRTQLGVALVTVTYTELEQRLNWLYQNLLSYPEIEILSFEVTHVDTD